MRYKLRGYQADAIDRVRASWRAGNRRICITAPTGSGKTSIACSIIEGAVEKGSRCLFLAHRTELITQASDRLDSIGLNHGILQANNPRRRPWTNVQVASIPTLVRRLDRKPTADLIIVDEAHHALASSYLKVLEHYPNAAVLGLTATPWRLDGKGLHSVFQDLIVVAQAYELVPDYLMAPRVFAPDKPNLSKIHITAGDFNLEELEQAMNTKRLVGNVVEHWQKFSNGARTLVFAVTVAHSMALRDRFVEAGIRAEHLDANTHPVERAAILDRLRAGVTPVVCNVGICTEGLDLPELGVVSLARPTQSSCLYLQMVGRIMRPAPGKPAPIVLDHADCVRRHGHPLDPREYTLEDLPRPGRGKKSDEESPNDKAKVCKTCFAVAPMQARVCPECGAPFIVMGPPIAETGHELTEQKMPTVLAGTGGDPKKCSSCGSQNIRPVKKPEKWGAYRALVICAACGAREWRIAPNLKAGRDEKQAEWERLEKVRIEKGFKPGWSWHQFKEIFGVWPSRYA